MKSSPFRPKITSTPESFPKTSELKFDISKVKWNVHAMGEVLLHNITDTSINIAAAEMELAPDKATAEMEFKTDTAKKDDYNCS